MTLEPIDPVAHADALYTAGHAEGDPELWTYLPAGPFSREEFGPWLEGRAADPDSQTFAVIDAATGTPQGMCSYMRIEPAHGVLEIGHIWFGAALQRTPGATEAIFLLARRTFDELGYRRLEWKCNAANRRSRRAAERFGFTYEGTFRQHMVVRGRNRDTAWYAMLDGDWPVARAGFERWLAPGNFDEHGAQRETLEALRGQAAG